MDSAWRASDWAKVEATVAAAFESQRTFIRERMESMLDGRDVSLRPFAAEMIARHSTAKELAGLARRLAPATFRDERRLFVRAIGATVRVGGNESSSQELVDEAYEALRPFVDDQDLLVISAAILGYADLGRPEAVGLFVDRIGDVPSAASSSQESERGVMSRAAVAAFEHLTGERPKSPADVRRWLADHDIKTVRRAARPPSGGGKPDSAVEPKVQPSPEGKPDGGKDGAADGKKDGEKATGKGGKSPAWLGEEDTWNGQRYRASARFNVFYRIGSTQEAPADGDLAFETIVPALERASDLAAMATSGVFGRVYTPSARLFLCDPGQFSARAKNAFFAGVTSGNEIILKVDLPKTLPLVHWHEFIHWIHRSYSINQPRWVSEGFAESYSLSAQRPISVMIAAQNPQLQTILNRGPFQEMLNWNAGGSSDSMEAARYATAHLCIDFLRYGGFSAPDTRLAFLMGRLSRRENGRAALEAVYGLDVKSLDERVRAWVAAGPLVPEK